MPKQSAANFQEQMLVEVAAAIRSLTTSIGIRLGLYSAMAEAGPVTAAQLAARTGTHPTYVREWLHAQASGAYIVHESEADMYYLSDRCAEFIADPEAPTYGAGFFPVLQYLYATEDQLVEAFHTGSGVAWDARGPGFDQAMGEFFLPGYRTHIVPHWLPALDGTVDRLKAGCLVADVGCGEGYSTLIMAEAFPESRFLGLDYSPVPIEHARQLAAERGLSDRVDFQVARADEYPGGPYDLITFFNCLHDIGDPQAAAQQVRKSITPDGTWMLVEPNAAADVEKNRHAAGQFFLALSAVMCLPVAMAQEGPRALGNHSGEHALRDIVRSAGFSRWRRAAETPVSAVYEVRP